MQRAAGPVSSPGTDPAFPAASGRGPCQAREASLLTPGHSATPGARCAILAFGGILCVRGRCCHHGRARRWLRLRRCGRSSAQAAPRCGGGTSTTSSSATSLLLLQGLSLPMYHPKSTGFWEKKIIQLYLHKNTVFQLLGTPVSCGFCLLLVVLGFFPYCWYVIRN